MFYKTIVLILRSIAYQFDLISILDQYSWSNT